MKLELDTGLSVDDIAKIDGIEFVDQDDGGVVIALASENSLAEFEARLSAIVRHEKVKGAEVIYALKDMTSWGEEDRKGPRLKSERIPDNEFLVDAELWSLDGKAAEVTKMRSAFETWAQRTNIDITDKLASAPYYRLSVDANKLSLLLKHRDVRFVDLLPRYGISPCDTSVDIQDLTVQSSLTNNAGVLAILDSGIASNHPLLSSAVGDAQSFIQGADAQDSHGHGTWVSGVALYGDVRAAIEARTFVPKIRLLSGKVLDDSAEYERKIILNSVKEAVEYFSSNYGCKVFNLSFGDNKFQYNGGRLQAFAIGLDQLARKHDVLFVVSAGNFDIEGFAHNANKTVEEVYPSCLLDSEAKVLDPGSAVNAVTVGSMAEYDRPPIYDDEEITKTPISSRLHPSPFTRSGQSIKGAIKPDFVDYGGNYTRHHGRQNLHLTELGQITFNQAFATDGRLFKLVNGTSFSAPRVSHLAARLHGLMPQVRATTIRAILGVHAYLPLNEAQQEALVTALANGGDSPHLSRLYGFGHVSDDWIFTSGDEAVTLYAEDNISNNVNHFYEIPIVDEFITGKKRTRKYTIALAHTPVVRASRLDYIATRIFFRLKLASSLDEVADIFSNKENAIRANENGIGSPEYKIGPQMRDRSTLQVSSFSFQLNPRKMQGKKLYLAVVRNDRPWAKGDPLVKEEEPYSLAVHFQDREAEQANLYNAIQASLQAKMQGRTQGRVRHNR
ncbi:MAG: S8 family peptidase [Alphaproteobacteria bacterium]|nr:S8 family peptidase [Alphaproteobacteria bacterium]